MPPTERTQQEPQKVDPRVYFAILFFRWKLIVVCFLYCLLAGVLYLEFAPKAYIASCQVMIYRDPTLAVTIQGEQWRSLSMYQLILRGTKLRGVVVEKLRDTWAKEVGSEKDLWLPVSASGIANLSILNVSVRTPNAAYGKAFLSALLEGFRKELASVQNESYGSAKSVLSEEIDLLDERIKAAENDVIEYERLHQMAYVTAKGSMEQSYLSGLMSRRSQLSTELMMLDAEFPALKGEDVFVIDNVGQLTRETGAVQPFGEEAKPQLTPKAQETQEPSSKTKETGEAQTDLNMWQDLKVQLLRLKEHEKELLKTLRPEHPEVEATRKKIADIQNQLDFYAQVRLESLKARRKAITIQVDGISEAERHWQDSYLLASKKQSDLKHLSMVSTRLEGMYQQLYSRLHDLKIDEELKSEHFIVTEEVRAGAKPVWPDPFKILIAALMAGLGAGIGLALLTHVFDNKVQSITDVESVVGVPFLGGIPYWVHSHLDARIRPIVSEEHSTGAAEAYRALRTNVLSALEKAGQKIVLVTSADSKEGKTLTVLNMAIMTARTGRKVLLLDMDLRRGVLHKSLDRERSPGITDVLREGRPLRDIVTKTSYDNLWFAPAGTSYRNTAELLHSVDLMSFFAEARDQYDIIFMDSAPVLRITDTVILASPQLCSVIYVAHANRTSKPTIRYSIDILEGANVIGLIINSIEMHKISSLYYAYLYPNYAYYSYAYAYGYDYYLHDEPGRGRRPQGAWKARSRAISQWVRKTFFPME